MKKLLFAITLLLISLPAYSQRCFPCVPDGVTSNPCNYQAEILGCHEITAYRYYEMIRAGNYNFIGKEIPIKDPGNGGDFIEIVLGGNCTDHIKLNADHEIAGNNNEITMVRRPRLTQLERSNDLRSTTFKTPAYYYIALFRAILDKQPVRVEFNKARKLDCPFADCGEYCNDIVIKVTYRNDVIKYYDLSDSAPPTK